MKSLLKSGTLTLIGIMVLYIIYLQQCKKYEQPDGYTLIENSVWDSVLIVADKPPVTRIDTFIEKGKTVHIHDTTFVYVQVNDSVNLYQDSTVNDKIRFWQDVWVQGIITKWEKRYEPVTQTITKEIKVFVPHIIETPVEVPSRGLYLSGIAGGNSDAFLFGAGIDLITKKGNLYGGQYQRFGDENFYSIRIGAKIRLFR